MTVIDQAVDYLTTHGFARAECVVNGEVSSYYDHDSGRAQVLILNERANQLAVVATTDDPVRLPNWEAELRFAPLSVIVATITAALA